MHVCAMCMYNCIYISCPPGLFTYPYGSKTIIFLLYPFLGFNWSVPRYEYYSITPFFCIIEL